MGPPVTLPSSLVGIREAIKGNSDSEEMQRTATAGFYAGFVGQGIEYTQIISKADYQLSMIITSAKGVNSINNPLSYLLFIKDFSLTQTLDAAKAGLQDVWNGTYDSAIGRRIGAGTFNYLLMTIGGAQLKGKGTACEAVESGSETGPYAYLEDEPTVGAGKDFTAAQKQKMLEENMKRNGGVVKSDNPNDYYDVLTKPKKSMKGVTPEPNEWQFDHIKPKDQGGTNSYSNCQIVSRKYNREKWNK